MSSVAEAGGVGSAYGRVTVIVPAALVCITVKCVNGVKCRENRQPIFADTHFYKSDLNQEKKRGGGDLNMITRKKIHVILSLPVANYHRG